MTTKLNIQLKEIEAILDGEYQCTECDSKLGFNQEWHLFETAKRLTEALRKIADGEAGHFAMGFARKALESDDD